MDDGVIKLQAACGGGARAGRSGGEGTEGFCVSGWALRLTTGRGSFWIGETADEYYGMNSNQNEC